MNRRLTWTAPGGTATLVADFDDERYYIETTPEFRLSDVNECADEGLRHGLELLDPDECEVELLLDGRMRMWMALIDGGLELEAA